MNVVDIVLLTFQLTFFVGARICDDLTWYQDANELLQGLSFGGLVAALVIKSFRSRVINKPILTLLHAQIGMAIPWFVTIVVAYFYYQTFGQAYDSGSNAFSILVILLTTMNYGMLCSLVLMSKVQILVYGCVLLGQMIFEATLLIDNIDSFQGAQKDCFILYESCFIAMQILITDILQRVYHKKHELQEKQIEQNEELEFNKKQLQLPMLSGK